MDLIIEFDNVKFLWCKCFDKYTAMDIEQLDVIIEYFGRDVAMVSASATIVVDS